MATYESRRYNTPVADVTKVADGSVDNTEFQYISSLSSNAQTQIAARLPLAGGTMSGNLDLNDNVRLRAGNSQDFEFFHDSSNSYIKNGTGVIVIQGDTVQFKNAANNATFLTVNSSSGVLSEQNYKATISTSDPSGGSNGDVWYKYS